jgi:hypothetical protein
MYDPAVVDGFRRMCESGAVTPADPVADDVDTNPDAAVSNGVPIDSMVTEAFDEIQVALELGAALSRIRVGPRRWPAVANALCEMPGVDTVAVFVRDDTEERLVARHVCGSNAAHIEQLAIPVGERMSGWVAASGQAMINADAALDLFDLPAGDLRSALAVPVDGPDGHRVVVALYSTRRAAFSVQHQRLVEAAAARETDQPVNPQVVDILQNQSRRHQRLSSSSPGSAFMPSPQARAR